MAGPLPLLLAGGAALVLLGGKKKSKPKRKSLAGQPCEADAAAPDGMICRGGILHPEIIDESMLEKYEEPTGEEAGDFETKEEDVSLTAEEEPGQVTLQSDEAVDPATMCDEFLQAIHVVPTEAGEIAINKVAVEQTAIPTMKAVMLGIHQNLGGKTVDAESVGPVMVTSALQELVPVCDWKFDDDEFTFSDGMTIQSAAGKDVLYGLMQLSVQLIDDFNESQQEDLPKASFQPAEVPKAKPGFIGG